MKNSIPFRCLLVLLLLGVCACDRPTKIAYQSEYVQFQGSGLPPYVVNEVHQREMAYRSSVLVHDREMFALRQRQHYKYYQAGLFCLLCLLLIGWRLKNSRE